MGPACEPTTFLTLNFTLPVKEGVRRPKRRTRKLPMRKMVFIQRLTEEQIRQIRETAPDWEIIHGGGKEPDVWKPHLRDAEIVAGWNPSVAEEVLSEGSAFRWLQMWSAGVDRLPLDELFQRGIFVTAANGVHANPISETVLGMMLALTRKLQQNVRSQVSRSWKPYHFVPEMHGKTVGIVGVGAIGSEVARLCKAFSMTVIGVRRSGAPAEHVDRMYDMQGLHQLLAESDYVVLTLPLTAETRRVIGERELALMKPNAFFVNIGRGATVDEAALIEALRAGRIAGAGLDVFEVEPLPAESPLWDMEQVIVAPHMSGTTEYYNDRVIELFVRNLRDYLAGGAPTINCVEPGQGY